VELGLDYSSVFRVLESLRHSSAKNIHNHLLIIMFSLNLQFSFRMFSNCMYFWSSKIN